MAEGRVVVASAVGGIPELIQDQVTGLLVTPNNVTALRDILGMCFKKWPKIRQLGDQARMYAQSQFSVQKMARAYEKIYLDLAKK
jgi:glycosyltransferase involved in cell wall biosynthesis